MQHITRIPGLDLQTPNWMTVGHAVQGDALSRWFEAPLLDGSTPWTPPAGASPMIRYQAADGSRGWYDTLEDGSPAVELDGSTVRLALADHVLAAAGPAQLLLSFYMPSGGATVARLSPFRFRVEVDPDPDPDGEILESSDYYNVLGAQIEAVLRAEANLTGLTASAETLETGSKASAAVSGGENGEPYHIRFGIPTGPVGPMLAVKSTATRYQTSSNGTTVPTGSWSASPSPAAGTYLWEEHTITYQNDSKSTFYSVSYQGRNGSGAVDSVLGMVGDVDFDATDLAIEDDSAYFTSQAGGASINQAFFEQQNARARTLSTLTQFRYAYRLQNEAFTAADILRWAQFEKDVYANKNGTGGKWEYITEGSGTFNDIPLYNVEDPSEVYNVNGRVSSCATAICNILYNCGLTEINENENSKDKGKAKYTNARVKYISLPYFLQQRGWKRIETREELQPGDIVFSGNTESASFPDMRYNPFHSFIWGEPVDGAEMIYDFGDTNHIQSAGPEAMSWETGLGTLATFGWNPTLFGFVGATGDPEGSGNSEWRGVTTQRRYSDGSHGLLAEMHDPSSLKYADFITKVSDGKYVTSKILYPVSVSYSPDTDKNLYILVKIYKSGMFQARIYGQPTRTLSAGIAYNLFSFGRFASSVNPNLGQIVSAYTFREYVTDSIMAKIEVKKLDVDHAYPSIQFTPLSTINSGTSIDVTVMGQVT